MFFNQNMMGSLSCYHVLVPACEMAESYDKIVSIVVEVLHTFPAQVEDSSCLFILVPMLSDCGLFERTFPNCYLGFSSKFSQKTEIREQAIIVPFCVWKSDEYKRPW